MRSVGEQISRRDMKNSMYHIMRTIYKKENKIPSSTKSIWKPVRAERYSELLLKAINCLGRFILSIQPKKYPPYRYFIGSCGRIAVPECPGKIVKFYLFLNLTVTRSKVRLFTKETGVPTS